MSLSSVNSQQAPGTELVLRSFDPLLSQNTDGNGHCQNTNYLKLKSPDLQCSEIKMSLKPLRICLEESLVPSKFSVS